MFKKFIKLLAICVSLLCVTIFASVAMEKTGVQTEFDLQGDGKLIKVKFPFSYFQKKQGDHLSFIHQSGYKVYDIANQQNEVAAIGLLCPCIGGVVTDSTKVVVFHKHSANSLDHIGAIIKDHLDLSDKSKLFARLYTVRDDLEWEKGKRTRLHNGNTQTQEVKRVKDYIEGLGFIRKQIPADIYNRRTNNNILKYKADFLGQYAYADLCVGIRMDDLFCEEGSERHIKFTSIDPFAEDICAYKGTKITKEELNGKILSSEERKKLQPTANILFDSIPELVEKQGNIKSKGYNFQGAMAHRRLAQEENEISLKAFGKIMKERTNNYQDNTHYNTLDFFPIP
ncbi:MAG: hypothetical protein K2X98_03045 [Alphaproteobacteria bacterium]|nr:hypothetical protein [Alphaproteobacteria bacterium]